MIDVIFVFFLHFCVGYLFGIVALFKLPFLLVYFNALHFNVEHFLCGAVFLIGCPKSHKLNMHHSMNAWLKCVFVASNTLAG